MKLHQYLTDYGSNDPGTFTPFNYDVLFAAAGEPVLIVDAATERIVEANPRAINLFGSSDTRLIGASLASAFEADSAQSIKASLDLARARGCSDALSVRVLKNGSKVRVNLSVFRTARKSYFLVRLASTDPAGHASGPQGLDSEVMRALERAPFGFLVTDADLLIDYANPEFIAMVGLQSPREALRKSLLSWLHLTRADLAALQRQLSQRQAVTSLTTKLRRGENDRCKVEVCAIGVPAETDTCWGFSVNEVLRLN